MSEFGETSIRCLALMIAGLLSARTARACYLARQRIMPASDLMIWAGSATAFLLMAQIKLARSMGAFSGWGEWLRALARQHDLYNDRRVFQIAITIAIAVVVILLLLYGLYWVWHSIWRYRLALALAVGVVGFVVVRFVSLHEVDAWNASHPWVPTAVDLVAAMGCSVLAVLRQRQLNASTLAQFY